MSKPFTEVVQTTMEKVVCMNVELAETMEQQCTQIGELESMWVSELEDATSTIKALKSKLNTAITMIANCTVTEAKLRKEMNSLKTHHLSKKPFSDPILKHSERCCSRIRGENGRQCKKSRKNDTDYCGVECHKSGTNRYCDSEFVVDIKFEDGIWRSYPLPSANDLVCLGREVYITVDGTFVDLLELVHQDGCRRAVEAKHKLC